MRPDFLDAVAFVLAGAICGAVLFVANGLTVPQPKPQAYQPPQFVNPFGPPPPVRITPPPPLKPYTSADCEAHVRSRNEAPQPDYINTFCRCFTSQRAALGPSNPSNQQSQNIGARVEEIDAQCQQQGIDKYMRIADIKAVYRKKFDTDCGARSGTILGEDSRRGRNDDLCRCVGDRWQADTVMMAFAIAGAGYYTSRPTFLETVNQCRKIVFPLSNSSGWQIRVDNDGRTTASVVSDDDPLIARIDFSCVRTGQYRLKVHWRNKPSIEQLYFADEEGYSETIHLKNGLAAGMPAAKFYERIKFGQMMLEKSNEDPDLYPIRFQSKSNCCEQTRGIILGDSVKRLAPIVQECAEAQPVNVANSVAPASQSLVQTPLPAAPRASALGDCQPQYVDQLDADARKKLAALLPTLKFEDRAGTCRTANLTMVALQKVKNAAVKCRSTDRRFEEKIAEVDWTIGTTKPIVQACATMPKSDNVNGCSAQITADHEKFERVSQLSLKKCFYGEQCSVVEQCQIRKQQITLAQSIVSRSRTCKGDFSKMLDGKQKFLELATENQQRFCAN